jgi:hypothetical protein
MKKTGIQKSCETIPFTDDTVITVDSSHYQNYQ